MRKFNSSSKGVYAYHSTWTLAAETGSARNLNGIPFLLLTAPILLSERSKSNVGPWEDTSYFSLFIFALMLCVFYL